jgi:site-specific DNA-cytosine methylase
LEDSVDDKYFLSPKVSEKVLKNLRPELRRDTEFIAQRESTQHLPVKAGGVGAKTGLVAPTIRATEYKHGDNQTTIAEDGLKIRRLTPTECERLMGLPDGWTAEGMEGKISDSQRYKLCGNGVVVNVVEEIIKRLIY